MRFKGAIFDLDGVIATTAKQHAAAWKEMFDKFLKDYSMTKNKPFIPFDKKQDYLKYLDGKPRLDGIKDFLDSRGISLSFGNKEDDLEDKTIQGLGNYKNRIYVRKIKNQKPEQYDSTIKFIKKIRKKGIKTAVVSSSKNCKLILDTLKLNSLFDTMVGGRVSEKNNLKGKPSPDIFIFASKKLKLNPYDCIVFEDAISGVKAGQNGNFGMVVGIERQGNRLKEADKRIKDLKELSLEDIENWYKEGIQKSSWYFTYNRLDKENEKLREALTTTGNGYIGIRGCFETQQETSYNYPGTYIAGIYNRLDTKIKGKTAKNNDLVNCPNFLLIKIKIGNSFVNPFENKILDYEKTLDKKNAVLKHKLIFEDNKGRRTEINSKRFSSMKNKNLFFIRFSLKPLNYSEKMKVVSAIDGNVENNLVARYRGLKSKHLKTVSRKKFSNGIMLHSKTNNSAYDIVMSSENSLNKKSKKKVVKDNAFIGEEFEINSEKNKEYVLEKKVSIFTSRDSDNPEKDSKKLLKDSESFKKEFEKHKREWDKLWNKADIFIEGDRFSQEILRLHIYHLLCVYSPNVKNLDLGIPARGLHGEAYHGHIFWDELYTQPFFINNFPELAKQDLLYRYNRLEQAKKYAKDNGYKGAMYPWQSADTGKEETQTIHYNPRGGNWGPDYSRNQRHISSAIFYNFYRYYKKTRDEEFLRNYGLEVMIEIARFWESISQYDKKTGKYHIKNVMGPDEFHEKYPWSKEKGFTDNAYTNVMASWLLEKISEIVERFPEEAKRSSLGNREIEKWKEISEKLNIHTKNKIIMQFKDYHKLKELDWKHYKEKYNNIERMDRILKAENDSPDKYKVSKQADVLMIYYVLGLEEATRILRKLGVKIEKPVEFLKKNYEYYESRTTHGSTLSRFVHAMISSNFEPKEKTWKKFRKTLETDIYDTQGGTTLEGIHCGLMAGSLCVAKKCFPGIKFENETLKINPELPKHWKKLFFSILDRNNKYFFSFNEKGFSLKLDKKPSEKKVIYKNKKHDLKKENKFSY